VNLTLCDVDKTSLANLLEDAQEVLLPFASCEWYHSYAEFVGAYAEIVGELSAGARLGNVMSIFEPSPAIASPAVPAVTVSQHGASHSVPPVPSPPLEGSSQLTIPSPVSILAVSLSLSSASGPSFAMGSGHVDRPIAPIPMRSRKRSYKAITADENAAAATSAKTTGKSTARRTHKPPAFVEVPKLLKSSVHGCPADKDIKIFDIRLPG
jgi:hypothetical protein